MRKTSIIICIVLAACAACAEYVKQASQPWVRAYVATNRTDVSGKADVTNVYTKAETDAKIVELAPTPGDYETVSNRAMSAIQTHQSLQPSTNYTDEALSAFAATGSVARAGGYGTPTRWTDASGDVWEIVRSNGWNVVNQGLPEGEAVDWHGPSWVTDTDGDYYPSVGWYVSSGTRTPDIIGTDPDATTLVLDWQFWRESEFFEIHTIFSRPILTNNVGRVALTNDIPATLPESDPTVPSWAKAGTKPSYSWNEITGKPQVVDETGAAAIAEFLKKKGLVK